MYIKKKLEFVEPSEEIKESYIIKSDSNLESSKILFNNNKLEESVSLAYYSMYHLLTALLFKVGIKSENHSASIILLKEVFGLDNKSIFEAKTERVDKQYYIDFVITNRGVLDAIEKAEAFKHEMIDFISKMNIKDVQYYRNKLKEIIN